MARRENRGGYRAPRDRTQKVSGVGANSKRTDNQPVRVPDFGTSEDLTFGDKQQIEARLRQQPLPQGRAPQVRGPAPAGAPSSAPGRGGPPPEFLFGMPTNRPMEPSSEGLPMGPGAGPEVLTPEPANPQEEVLQKLSEVFGDEFADQMLLQLREARPEPTVQPPPIDEMAPTGEEVEAEDEPGIVDFPMEEEEAMPEEELQGEEVQEEEVTEVAPEEMPQGDEAVAEASVEGEAV